MNVKPIVLVLVVVGCTVFGWIIGRHTLVRVEVPQDSKSSIDSSYDKLQTNLNRFSNPGMENVQVGKNQFGKFASPMKNSGKINDLGKNAFYINSIRNQKRVFLTTKTPNFLQKLLPTTKKYLSEDVQDTLRKTQVASSGGLKAYSHDGKTWTHDEGFCHSNREFQKANLQTKVGSTPIYIHNPREDIWISKDLMNTGHWEGGFVNLVFSLLQKDPELQFVDLGANIGVFALSVAKLGRKVIAVEPLSINLQRLCKSVSAGTSVDGKQFTEKVTIIHNALSDAREKVQLGKDLNNVGGTFVMKDSNEKKIQGSSVAGKYSDVVMTAKLDDLLELPNFNFKKVVLKIDVEGYETKTFLGGQKFFDTVDVQAILMEWRWHTGAHDLNDLLNFFTKRNYKPYDPKVQPPRVLQVRSVRSWPGDVLWLK